MDSYDILLLYLGGYMATAQIEKLEAIAYRDSIKEDLPKLTTWLLEHLGQRITAVALGLSDASMLRRYKQGDIGQLKEDREARLRLLYRVARMVSDAFDNETARAFLISSNPQLGDKSPAVVLSDEPPDQSGPEILGAARALIEG